MNVGWPYCFHDFVQNKLLLNPEYGGDGKTVGRCSEYPDAGRHVSAALGAGGSDVLHRHAVSEAVSRRRLHRVPRIVESLADAAGRLQRHVPAVCGDKPSGKPEIFADGFAGKDPIMQQNDAAARADGVAQAPDGSLYIAESVKGKIWRVLYTGK